MVASGPGPARSAVARWAALLCGVYLAFCWLAFDRTLIPDEIWALTNAEQPWSVQLASIRSDLVHPPLIYVLERAWIAVFGLTDVTAKLLPIPINLTAICAFTVLAARTVSRYRIASALYLTVYLHVFSAANLVRGYGLLLLLTILAIIAWDRWRTRPSLPALGAWTVLCTLCVLTHLFGVLLVAAFALTQWLTMPKRLSLTVAALIPAAVIAAWGVYVYPVYAERGLHVNVAWVEPSLWRAMLAVPYEFLTTVKSGDNPVQPVWWSALPAMRLQTVLAIALPAALFGLAAARQGRALWRHPWFVPLAVLVAAPFCMLAAVSLAVGPAFDSRFLLGCLPAFWLLLVLLAELGSAPGQSVLMVAVVPVSVLSVLLPLRHDLAPSPLREAAQRVARDYRESDVVLCSNSVGLQAYWELRRIGVRLPIALVPANFMLRLFAARPVQRDRVWVFCAGGCNETLERYVSDQEQLLHLGRYLWLYRYRSPPPPGQ